MTAISTASATTTSRTGAEWGPAKHRRDDEGADALDLRDGAGERPDDN